MRGLPAIAGIAGGVPTPQELSFLSVPLPISHTLIVPKIIFV